MAQKQPVKLQELAKLGAAGIKPEDLNFKSVTMDSGAHRHSSHRAGRCPNASSLRPPLAHCTRLACAGAFICIRETAAKSVAIIDTANPSNTQRMPAPVELSCARSAQMSSACQRDWTSP